MVKRLVNEYKSMTLSEKAGFFWLLFLLLFSLSILKRNASMYVASAMGGILSFAVALVAGVLERMGGTSKFLKILVASGIILLLLAIGKGLLQARKAYPCRTEVGTVETLTKAECDALIRKEERTKLKN